MPVQIPCPGCDSSYSVADENLGKIGRCKRCGKKFPLVPTSRFEPPPSDSASITDPEPGPQQAEAKLPESFGRYKVVRLLGRGGMGAVYLAHDTLLNREVALKVPHLHAFTDRPEVRKRFFVEAQAAARFHHPNFCPIFDIGEEAGVPYLALAYIQGKTLAASIDRGQGWPDRKAAEVVRELALALAKAHREGIIHRDLKPANIMIDGDGRLILMDFGLARWHDGLDSTLTPTGAIIGTPAYMPPEQAESKFDAVGPRSDIYSLGVILYELLTGRRPFEGPIAVVFSKILFVEPEPPADFRPGIDARLEAICLKAMAKKPEDRQPSMDEFSGELTAFLSEPAVDPWPEQLSIELSHEPLRIEKPSRLARSTLASNHSTEPRNPVLFGSLGALVLAALFLGVAYMTSSKTPASPGRPSDFVKSAPVPKPDTNPQDAPVPNKPAEPSEPVVVSPPPLEDDPIPNKIGMKLKLIPAGEFFMGSADGEFDGEQEPTAMSDEKPQHKVRINRPFYLGVYEVTQGEYKAVMGPKNPSYFSASGGGQAKVASLNADRLPVERVSWLDAIAFCNKLSEIQELDPCYTAEGQPIESGTGYRLPTEAEWEYACRGATKATTSRTMPFSFGAKITATDANFDVTYTYNGSATGNYLGHTKPVGSYLPNAFGLHDMHGNVWEWCADAYEPRYYMKFFKMPSPVVDPQNFIQADRRVFRGGGWLSPPQDCRSANRTGNTPDFRDDQRGFRVARVFSGK